MATFYGAWAQYSGSPLYRTVIEVTVTSNPATSATIQLVTKIQYGSAFPAWPSQLSTTLGITTGINGSSATATGTVSYVRGGTQTLNTRTLQISKTHAAQSIAVSGRVAATLSGSTVASSTASGTQAVSAKTSYKVTYSANGGDTSSVPDAQTKWHGETLALSATVPRRAGFTFLGWNTKANGTGTNYAPGASYTGNAALTLYAMWLGASVPSIECERTDSEGAEADEGTYGSLTASWQASGTVAATVTVTAQNVTASSAIALDGDTSGSVVAGGSASGNVSSIFGGTLDTDTRYAIRVTVTVSATGAYAGNTVTATATAYVTYAYITMDFRVGGHGVSFGATAVEDGMHVYMPATFHGEVNGTWHAGTTASTDGTVTELPAAGTYLLVTAHNSTPALNGIWMVRTAGNVAFNLVGGGNVTTTVSGTSVTVKTTAGSPNVYYQRIA